MTIRAGVGNGWLAEVGRHTAAHRIWKIFGLGLFLASFMPAYLVASRHPFFPVHVVPYLAIDRLLGFQAWSLLFYVSFWAYLSIAPWMLADLRDMAAYAVAMAAVGLTGLAIFVFWPTRLAAPDPSWSISPAFSWLRSVDRSGNACPSLHAAFTIFSALEIGRQLRRHGEGGPVRILNALWCLAILYSTLATKQHGVIDLAAGLALGLLGASFLAGLRALQAAAPSLSLKTRSRLVRKIFRIFSSA